MHVRYQTVTVGWADAVCVYMLRSDDEDSIEQRCVWKQKRETNNQKENWWLL